jgi:hypothetical protein
MKFYVERERFERRVGLVVAVTNSIACQLPVEMIYVTARCSEDDVGRDGAGGNPGQEA